MLEHIKVQREEKNYYARKSKKKKDSDVSKKRTALRKIPI